MTQDKLSQEIQRQRINDVYNSTLQCGTRKFIQYEEKKPYKYEENSTSVLAICDVSPHYHAKTV